MPTPISLGVRSNQDRTTQAAQLINCYAESIGDEGKIQYPVYACDGYEAFSTLSGGGVTRGMLNLDDTWLYVVTGSRLFRVSPAGTANDMGAISTSGVAYMARNRKSPNAQVGICTSDGVFKIIENNSVSVPSLDSSIPTFNSICALDGYFIFTSANGEWFITSIDEGSTIDPIEFAQANSNPDGAVRGIVRGRDLIIAGQKSLEFYQNTGATDFPFERTTSTGTGVYAAPSMVNLTTGDGSDTVVFAGNNSNGDYAGVFMLQGYAAQKISPFWLDRTISDETSPSSIRAFTYARRGHTFYCITGTTFSAEFNATTSYWHRRKSSGLNVWRCAEAASFAGYTIFGDYTSGLLYKSRHDLTPASASQIKVRKSRDGGNTWGSYRAKSVGASGATTQRVRFNRLGQSKEDGHTFEITFSNAIVENGTDTDMIVIPPSVNAWPSYQTIDTLYVDSTPGSSQTNTSKGITGLGVDQETGST